MTTVVQGAVNLNEIAAAWREARRIYPIYAALIRQFDLGVLPNKDLESPINRSEPTALDRIANWFDEVDSKCEVWQLRQVLQTAVWVSDDQLRAIARRHLIKQTRDAMLRDKVDYLIVQYYAHHCPEDAHNNRNITFKHVAEVLQEVTGPADTEPGFVRELDSILADLSGCASLKDLIAKKIVERTRAIKERLGDQYFACDSLVTFARFNFILRLGFFRLMHADLHAIRAALHAMEQRGQSVCDCSKAGLSATEAISELRNICHEWKKPFRAAYSAAVNFQQIISLRQVVEAAVSSPAPKADPALASPPVASTAGTALQATSKVEVPASPKQITVEECIEQIAERLLHTAIKNASVTNLMFGSLKVMLASWEVSAFKHGGDDTSDTLQRAVAARVALQLAIEEKKEGRTASIKESIAAAHAEAAQMQERIAAAKEQKNVDAAVNLAASSKRLLALIAEAEQLR
jgi:hypothetical protein